VSATLRLLTANLLHGRAEPAALAALLEERAVDVACFQELGEKQVAAVAEVLPHGKLEPSPRRDSSGMGVALRRPAEMQALPLPRRNARVALLRPADWPGLHAPVEVVNVHIQAPHVRPWSSLPLRRSQLANLCDYLDERPLPHRIVAGDFNATPLWPAHRRLAERLTDGPAAFAAREGRRAELTWGPWPGAPRLLRIDHVMHQGLHTVACERLPIAGSDHDAVLVTLILEG
jgi:endonuclease/exonuclease/phosphatase (EEP) superfamily protein YafD